MKEPIRRDSLLTIISLALLSGIFVFLIYLPGQRSTAAINREIAAAEQGIEQIPVRIAELESLHDQAEQRRTYLSQTDSLMLRDADLHTIISQVASMAEQARLRVSRLEPLKAVQRETYDVLPVRISFEGTFGGVATFLSAMEGRRRLFIVDEYSLKSQPASENVAGDVYFSVYVSRIDSSDSAENRSSSDPDDDDTRIR